MAKNKKTQTSKVAKEEKKVDDTAKDPKQEPKQAVQDTISENPDTDKGIEKESLESKDIEPDTSKEPGTQLTFKQAEAEMGKGIPVKLPEWGGFWFKKVGEDQIYVMTREGDIVDTSHDEYKERNDWMVTEANEIQSQLLDGFWAKRKQDKIDAENKKILEDNNSLKALFYSRSYGGQFIKVPGKLTVSDLLEKKFPPNTNIGSEFVLENGSVFSVKENAITNKDLSNQLPTLKKQKSK